MVTGATVDESLRPGNKKRIGCRPLPGEVVVDRQAETRTGDRQDADDGSGGSLVALFATASTRQNAVAGPYRRDRLSAALG